MLPELKPRSGWSSPGVSARPDYCRNCPYGNAGSGFCLDSLPASPKLVLLTAYPGKDDLMEQQPWSGSAGQFWTQTLLGGSRENAGLCNILRCRPPKLPNKRADEIYPTGDLRRRVELACRHWDSMQGKEGQPVAGGITSYNPNLFLITFALNKLLQVQAFLRLAQEDVRKALHFADKGFRPLVLMGAEAMELVAPWAEGGVRSWRGHWWEGEWPFAGGLTLPEPRRSFATTENRWRKHR